MKDNFEYRLYGFVPYNLSEIQKGIQFGHAAVEYSLKYFKDKDYQQWAKKYKTFIILNGGTTNNGEEPHLYAMHDDPYVGTMQKIHMELKSNGIKCSTFFEPDLNDALSAIVFLVDERVFNKKEYPDFELDFEPDGPMPDENSYEDWLKNIGGKRNEFLREFLSKYKLA